ncbi:hypothetical protein EYF80_040941 [Liparis tanakae]|uniref:Uncharacterized protein n=1 Tax=Liparis tanakae TaxID=230148 RepID=A0A4Z2G6X0_9TELE|nr:hypothetical protein EYF80_040941 [Liparis tanakae]
MLQGDYGLLLLLQRSLVHLRLSQKLQRFLLSEAHEQPVPLQGLQPELGLGLQYGSSHQQLAEDADVQLLSLWVGQAGLSGHQIHKVADVSLKPIFQSL